MNLQDVIQAYKMPIDIEAGLPNELEGDELMVTRVVEWILVRLQIEKVTEYQCTYGKEAISKKLLAIFRDLGFTVLVNHASISLPDTPYYELILSGWAD
jgi:hypothetical protein